MRWIAVLLSLLVFGCSSTPEAKNDAGSEPTKEAASAKPPTAEPGSPTPRQDTPAAPTGAPNKSTEATLNEKQLLAFFAKIGSKIGHEGLTAKQQQELVEQIKSVPKGEEKGGPLHLDHKGRHLDVLMTAKHLEADRFLLKFESPDGEAVEAIGNDLKASAGK
ncbi:MAG TPA: hypothetical protein VGE01_12200 [Fimbriimonas sp.]